ncbi:hypothetical protein [Treponema sp. OMZ 857]|uniref:hypothetical protein n=1 Tax=Treponema sp. OMZ 857 TaxID=1643513 RepID=UPI0020A5A523|nr:hypothetical protein [Treponema sp. OMZ 857]UTC44873.1 hypothetical protein E4N66_12705 [Treponema sp. OMZ 857]
MEELNTVGFHANYKNECERFIDDKEYLIVSSDTDFLGRGMYFWMNYKQAIWWKNTKKKEGGDSLIVSAKVHSKNVLDVTDVDVLNKLERLYSKIRNELSKKMQVKHDYIQLGIKLDALFHFFEKDLSVFDCVYGTAENKNRPEHAFLKGTPMTMKTEGIILVKNYKAISDRQLRSDLT